MKDKLSFGEKNGTKQILPAEYLLREREDMPKWLEECTADKKVCIGDLLKSRIVFNPGGGVEGPPIRTFNSAHAVHVFVYVDYGFTRDEIDTALSNDAFRGYHLLREQNVSPQELLAHPPIYHVTSQEKEVLEEFHDYFAELSKNAFGMLKVYERDDEFSDEHGSKRFAMLYLGADAIATYDALFGNTDTTPLACVVDAYGFDGSYDHFARGSLIEKIARRTNRLPKYLLCAHHCEGWEGYQMLKTVGGSRGRFLWKREDECDDNEKTARDDANIVVFEDC